MNDQAITKTVSSYQKQFFRLGRRQSNILRINIAAFFALGCGYTTSLLLNYGVGLSSDTLSYFQFPLSGSWSSLPVHHGILYPLLLRMTLNLTGMPLLHAAAYLNIVCAGFTAAGTFIFFTRNRPYGPITGSVVSFLICFSLPFLACHTLAMSEPLFTLLFSMGLYLLIHYCQKGTVIQGLLSALLMAASCLTRYAGLAFVGAACLSILCFSGGRYVKRWVAAALYGTIATLPLACMLLINKLEGGTATNRDIVFHWIPTDSIWEGVGTLFSWFAPDRIFIAFPVLGIACAIILGGLLVIAWAYGILKTASEAGILALFAMIYLLFLLVSITFFDVSIMLSHRMLEPLIFSIFPLLAIFMFHGHSHSSKFLRLAGILLFTYWMAFTTYRAIGYVHKTYSNGSGFSSRAWSESAFIQFIETIQTDYVIYSNAADALHLRGSSNVCFIPSRQKSTSGQDLVSFHKDYGAMSEDLQHRGAFLANVNLRYWPPYRVPLEQIVEENNMLCVMATQDGMLYSTPDNPNLPTLIALAKDVNQTGEMGIHITNVSRE